ncbi:hypothetical protein ACFL5O_11235, partial [Myxococcota bacterium]
IPAKFGQEWTVKGLNTPDSELLALNAGSVLTDRDYLSGRNTPCRSGAELRLWKREAPRLCPGEPPKSDASGSHPTSSKS